MIGKIRSHLGIKLFIILAAIIILTVAPLTYTAIQLFKRYGNQASGLNEQQIRLQASNYLQQITRERARRYQEFFDRIASSASLMGSQAATLYSDLPFFAERPLHQYQLTVSHVNGIFLNNISDPVLTAFWGDSGIDTDIQLELNALSHMTPLFLRALDSNPEVLASHSLTTSGIGQYCTNNMRNKEAVFNLPPASVFDLRDGEPMTIFKDKDSTDKNVRWTNIYKDDVIEGLMLTASAPIYDNNGIFRGITGIDVPLDTVTNDILQLDSDSIDNYPLFSFLLDKDSRIIALPHKYFQLLGLPMDRTDFYHSDDRLDLQLSQSVHESVRKLAHQLTSYDEWLTKLTLSSEPFIVASSTMTTHGWIFGVAARENDLLTSVRESRSVLEKTVSLLEVRVVYFSLFSIAIAICIIFLLLKYLITPLRDLADATLKVAEGDLSIRSQVSTMDEVGVLSASFNKMVSQLEDIQFQQNRYTDSLIHTVEQRNSELGNKNAELERTTTLLNREVEQRLLISEALSNSRQQYYDTLEATTSGAFIIEENIFTYVNKVFADQIIQGPKESIIGMNPLDLVHEDDQALVASNMQRRIQGEEIPPYVVQCRRANGSLFYAEVWAKITKWHEKPIMVGTVTDVTHIKEAEKLLHRQDQQLQKSLEEKEVLLKEIYHRTKNNMMVIISMLDLQAQEIADERLKTAFLETENRIRTMAMVHEKLYQSKNLSEIDIGSYLIELCNSILATMVLDKNRIQLDSQIDHVAVNIDYAIPIGLIVNEIITNSIKHAFPDGQSGRLYVGVEQQQDGHLVLTVADDGIGLPDNVDPLQTRSFGVGIIIASLVKIQLKGQITIDRSSGTRYLIRFPQPKNQARV